ncbi:MAG: zinc-binding dehydrogenase [Chloroflexia bacterium]|nr:zinc-binding dehydrogenase [Chloroflexia bacterium]
MRIVSRRAEAVVFGGRGDVTVSPVDLPEIGHTDVLMETRVSVVSTGTEGWILTDRFHWGGSMPYPLVPGYQKAGVVLEVGAGVDGLAPGDRVFMTTSKVCEPVHAFSGGHISLSQEIQSEVLKLPAEVSDLEAANLVVAQVGYNAASRPRIHGGEVAAVFGDGMIGQMAAQALRARGARVVLCGRRQPRLELARRYSADVVVNVAQHEARWALSGIAPGGVQVIVDTTPSPDMSLYLDVLQPRDGQVVLSGFYPGGLDVDADALQKREVALLTNSGWTCERLDATLDLVARGLLRTTPLITHRFSYHEAPEAWSMIRDRDEDVLGVAFDWTTP